MSAVTATSARRLPARRRFPMLAAVLGSVSMLACAVGRNDRSAPRRIAGGDVDRGRAAIVSYGCGSCHDIPGIRGAVGRVGPPLWHWSRRVYIAGQVPNTDDFLVRWIEVPQAIEPNTAMPNLRVPEEDARDIAAYLYTLQ